MHWFHQSGCCVAHFRQDWRKTRLTVLPLASVLTLTARYRDHFSLNHHHFGSELYWKSLCLMAWISLLVWSLWITHMGVYIWNNYRSLESVCNVATDRTHGRLPRAVQCCRWWPTVQCTAHTVHLYTNIGRNVTGTQACRLSCDQEIMISTVKDGFKSSETGRETGMFFYIDSFWHLC